MQGSLSQIQLPEILQFLSMGKGSGFLSLSRAGTETILFVRNGKIINSSSLERQRRLGELLIQRGILRRSTLSEVLRLQRTIESDKRLGQILVERDIVTEQTIKEVLRMQLEEEIWTLFGWEDGEFKFEAAEDSKLGDDQVQIEIEPLILEGTRRQDEWKKIQKTLPDDTVVLSIKPAGDDFRAKELKLSPAEWRVLAQINGRFTIRAVINRSAMGRFEVFQILNSFLKRGFVTKKAPPVHDPKAIAEKIAASNIEEIPGSKSKSGIFAGLLGGGKKDKVVERHEFASPVGLFGAFLNAVIHEFMNTKEFRSGTAERNVLEKIWSDILMSYTRADLVRVEGSKLLTERAEQYFEMFEFSSAIQDTYEDTMEALYRFLDSIYRYFAGRMGDKNATRIVREVLAEVTPRAKVRFGESFNLEERVQSLLKLAA